MANLILWQLLAVLMVAVIVACASSVSAGVSTLLGGMSVAIPNTLFALQLYIHTKIMRRVSPVLFFVGECLKIGMTIVLLSVAIRFYPHLYWPTFLVGLVVALKSYLIVLLKKN